MKIIDFRALKALEVLKKEILIIIKNCTIKRNIYLYNKGDINEK